MFNSKENTVKESLLDFIDAVSIKSEKGITFILGESIEKSISYKELLDNSLRLLKGLNDQGITKGAELIILIDDIEYFLYIFWACLLGNIIAVPLTYSNSNENRLKILKIVKILNNPFVLTTEKIKETLEKPSSINYYGSTLKTIENNIHTVESIINTFGKGERSEVDSGSIAFIQFSSGSTGDPKGVTLTHENLITNINACIKCSETTIHDSTLNWMPLTHDMGLIGLHLLPIVIGINQFIMPTSLFIKHPSLWISKTSQHKVTIISSPNFGYKYFLSHSSYEEIGKDWDLSRVRLLYNGAEPISANLCNLFLDGMSSYGLKRTAMYPVYGLAEACVAVSFPTPGKKFISLNLDRNYLSIGQKPKILINSNPEFSIQFVDVGYAVDNCCIRIYDENNNILEDNTIGIIHIKGKNVTGGYYNNNEISNKIIGSDGWLNTGDIGFLKNGRLCVTGRVKDIIFVNGQNYYPHDIERIAENVEGIELGKVVACGVFNEDTQTEEIVIFILFKGDLEEFIPLMVTSKKYLNDELGLDIKHILPVKKIPKTTSGKIQRYKLSENFKNGEFSFQINEIEKYLENQYVTNIYTPINAIEEKLFEFWVEILGIEKGKIDINENFFASGGNSLKAVILGSKIQEEFDIEIPFDEMYNLSKFKELANYIEKSSNKTAANNIENRHFLLLNDKKAKCIFAFPPLLGFGLAYKNLSNYLSEYSLYSFDYIEEENRLMQYVETIVSIQKEGPYNLLGFSLGGKLAYEVSNALLSGGHQVSNLIIVDSLLQKPISHKTPQAQGDISTYGSAILQAAETVEALKESSNLEIGKRFINKLPVNKESISYILRGGKAGIEAALNRRSMNYILYSSMNMKKPVKINADIHLIKSPATGNSNTRKWSALAGRSFNVYNGSGRHGDMIEPKYVEKNAEIIKDILDKIL